jgi:hypothetical protein
MMGLPLFASKPKERHLLVVELEGAGARLAHFHDSEGELTFGGSATGASAVQAYESLPEKPNKVTDLLIGVPFNNLLDDSTVIRYHRPHPQEKITEGEVQNTFVRIPPIENQGEVFFEDLFNAKVDGLPTLDPVERLGELVELNYYQVAATKELLDWVRGQVKGLGPTPNLVPTAYAIAKLISQANPKGALTLDIEAKKTEASLSAEGHLIGIKSFDIGGENLEHFVPAMEVALEEMRWEELWPEQIFLCGTVANYEEIRSELLAYPWTKKINMMNFPEISVFHPLSVNLTLPADVGLNALSLLG